MIFSYLTPDNIFERYKDSKKYTEQLTKPFPEFERLARNRPHESIDPAYPKTTDGTTASIIRKTPKRIIQQLPTGTVVAEDDGWLGIVAEYILTERIIYHANQEYNLIQKAWSVIEGGLTFGSTATYTPFVNHDGMFTPDMTIPYWGDIFIQKGKKSGYACDYIFMRSWWQKEDIQALIDAETKTSKKSKGYTPTWDTKALKSILESKTSKDQHARAPFEDERGIESNAIELVTAFQKGVGAKFYTFNPTSQTIVRTKVNKDPRGKMPIDWMYGDIDGSNPLGRGIVELIGPLQNLIDGDMQSYQYNRALALQPPVLIYGNIGDFKYVPNAVIDARNDPTAKVVPLTIDTSSIAQYPALYGLQKSQLLNLVNSPDTSISSDIGNPSFSKTDAGVKQQAQTVSVDDNYVTKMFETWFGAWGETAINLYFAERSGVEELQLDKETAMRLRELPNFDESLISQDNKIRIDYDTATPALKFRVNPSTTKIKNSSEQVQSATNLLDLVMKYPMLNSSYGGPIDIEVLSRRIVSNSGIDDPEQVAPEPTEEQKQQKEAAKRQVSAFSPMFDKPSIRMNFPDLPPAAQVQVLANAGIQVSIEDVMQGPVVDPNIRGVMNPMSDPNAILPGQQPGQPQSQAPQAAPIDLGDIYKLTTDPQIKAQIEQMAGLTPNPYNVQDHIETNLTNHAAQQAQNVQSAAQALGSDQITQSNAQSQPTNIQKVLAQKGVNESQSTQLSPLDQQIIQELTSLGFSQNVINQAIQMIENGATAEQVMQALGVRNG